MKPYVGTKIILAEPADRDGQAGYRVRYAPDGYESWSPKPVFEEAYRPINEGEANFASIAMTSDTKGDL